MLAFVPDAADESVAARKTVQQHLNIKEVDRICARKNFVLFLVQLHERRIDPVDAIHNDAGVQIAVEIHTPKDKEVIDVPGGM